MASDATSAHQDLQPVTTQRPSTVMVAKSPHPTFKLTGASADLFDLPSESCIANYPLRDILLQVGLGHTLRDSRSHLAALPLECLQDLAQHIRALFIQELRDSGRITPVQDACEEDKEMNLRARPPAPRRTAKKMQPRLSLHDAQRAHPPFAGGKQGCRQMNFWDFALPSERDDDLFPEM